MASSTTKRSSTDKSTTAKATSKKTLPPAKPKPSPKTTTKAALVSTAASSETVRTPDPIIDEHIEVSADLPMRKKELIDLVVERSGIKKKDAKPVVEAMLAVLGEAIGGGRELNMQPLGKLRINRSIERSNGRIIVCKLRQSTATGENSIEADITVPVPLAEDDS